MVNLVYALRALLHVSGLCGFSKGLKLYRQQQYFDNRVKSLTTKATSTKPTAQKYSWKETALWITTRAPAQTRTFSKISCVLGAADRPLLPRSRELAAGRLTSTGGECRHQPLDHGGPTLGTLQLAVGFLHAPQLFKAVPARLALILVERHRLVLLPGCNIRREVTNEDLRRTYLQFEQFPQPARLHTADRNLGVLFIVHAELIARLEPWHHFLNPVDVHQERPMYAPEHLAVQAGLQVFDGAIVRLPFQIRGHQRDQTAVNCGVDHIVSVDDEIPVIGPHEQLAARSRSRLRCGAVRACG